MLWRCYCNIVWKLGCLMADVLCCVFGMRVSWGIWRVRSIKLNTTNFLAASQNGIFGMKDGTSRLGALRHVDAH